MSSNIEAIVMNEFKPVGIPLPKDTFAERFDKPDNKFFNLDVSKPIRDEQTKRTYFVKAKLQIVVQPDGQIFAREV